MKYYIGIDGGGTKTEFVLTDGNEKVINRIVKGGSNPNDIGIDACVNLLREGIFELSRAYDKNNLYVFAGVSGAGVGENAKRLTQLLTKEYPNAKVASDLMNALEICLGDKDGLAVICGTGISCCICKSGELKTVGGYGYLFEDGGSGYAYGRDAVKAVLRAEDGIGPATILTEYFYGNFNGSVRNALGEILRGGKALVASFCPFVFKGCTLGDKVSQEIVERNLAFTVAIVKDALLVGGDIKKVSFIGGVSQQAIFRERISKEFSGKYEVLFCDEKPVLGAVRKAIKERNANES